MRTMTNRLHSASAKTRPARTADRAMTSDRNRSMSPVVEILGHADGGALGTEHHGHHEDSGHEVIGIANDDAVGEAVGLLEGLGGQQHRRAVTDALPDEC